MTDGAAHPGLDPATFFERPDVYPLDFDAGQLALVPMSRDAYRRSIFMDRNRIVPAEAAGWQVSLPAMLQEFERRAPAPRPMAFVFHMAHCGSTLLARALDVPGRSLVLREPYTLRQLGVEAAARPAGPANPELWGRCLRLATGLLSRRWEDREQVVVKANVPVNFMIGPLLDAAPGSRGVLLHCGFERYLLSVMKTPMHCNWVDNVTRQLAGGIRATPGFESVDAARLQTAEAAACLWAVQMRRYESALAAHQGLASLDCDLFLASPHEVLAGVAHWLGLGLADPELRAIADSGLFRRHGKDPGRAYSRADRERELEALRAQLAGPLRQARDWLDARFGEGMAGTTLDRPVPAAAG